MALLPLARMWDRVAIGRSDSDTTLFHDLMYLGEMVVKTCVSALVAAIEDDRAQSRYRLLHGLIRADGIGAWDSALDDVLTGPASQHLLAEAKNEQRDLLQKNHPGTWQYEAVDLLAGCVRALDPTYSLTATKV